jgi:hypothetical protein
VATVNTPRGVHKPPQGWFGDEGTIAVDKEDVMAALLWIVAVVLVVAGIVTAIRGQVLLGIVLVVVGLLVGPGGVSIFT